jgi:hypothetical protein
MSTCAKNIDRRAKKTKGSIEAPKIGRTTSPPPPACALCPCGHWRTARNNAPFEEGMIKDLQGTREMEMNYQEKEEWLSPIIRRLLTGIIIGPCHMIGYDFD